MRAIVTGLIATYPVGGVVWDYGQYAIGLEQLGYEVYYLEDTGGPTYDPVKGMYGEDCAYSVNYLHQSLASLSPSLANRWHFRNIDGKTYGMEAGEFRRVVCNADLFLNVSGGCLLRDEYMSCPRKILVDTDPGWNHFVNYPNWDANPNWLGSHGFRAHDYFFTYAQQIGRPGCKLPSFDLVWHPTRPPVILDRWQAEPPGVKWTTVMTWDNFHRRIEHDGVIYGTKELEFIKIEKLPSLTGSAFELAVGGSKEAPYEHWRMLGWEIVDSHAVSKTTRDYQSYIQASRGEFSVAKNLYVATRSGWFSCRSVCYLAAGRPVVVQETGFSDFIPAGEGLLAFSTLEKALQAIAAVESNYEHHQEAAREIARKYFAANVVLGELLGQVGLGEE